jgi:hypothetical protein
MVYSSLMSLSAIVIFIYHLSYSNLSIFIHEDSKNDNYQMSSKTIVFAILSAVLMYLIRYIAGANKFIFYVTLIIIYVHFSVIACHGIFQSNILIEQSALKLKENGDHVRNIGLFVSSISRAVGGLLMSSFAAFNYWRDLGFNLGKFFTL